MTKSNNMYINFKLNIDSAYDKESILSSTINKPIIVNNIPVGVITDVRLDESGLNYDCLGIIWNKFIDVETRYDYCNEVLMIDSIIVKG